MNGRPNDDVALEIGHLFLEVLALRRQSSQLVDALTQAQEELKKYVGDDEPTVEEAAPAEE